MARRTLLIAMLLAAGCGTKNYNVASPVLGPPPPRIQDAAARQSQVDQVAQSSGKKDDAIKTADAEFGQSSIPAGGVQQVSFEQKPPLLMSDVVARVNGKPILASDLLEQYSVKLNEFRDGMQAAVNKGAISQEKMDAKLRETQEMLIKRDLDHHIEQVLMATAVRAKLKKDQLESINTQLADYFEKDYVGNLKTKFEAKTTVELEGILQAQGMSLESMRAMFMDQQMASQYVRTKMGEDPKPSRAELVKLYNSQLDKYAKPTQVKWQQLQIKTSRQNASGLMEEAQAALKSGTSFDDVVKKYSDGPHQENGGNWDWTQPESVASPEIRKALQSMKSGEMSAVLTTGNTLQLIKVTSRREAGHQPMVEVQEDLRQQIIGEFRERRAAEVVAEIRKEAIIETIFDQDSPPEK